MGTLAQATAIFERHKIFDFNHAGSLERSDHVIGKLAARRRFKRGY